MSRSTSFYGLSVEGQVWLESNCNTKTVREIAKEEYDKFVVPAILMSPIAWSMWKKAFDIAAERFKYIPYIPYEETEEIVEGMFGEKVHKLRKYTTKEGKKVLEYVQYEQWDSGPNIYTSLKYEDGTLIPEADWLEEDFE